jgi:Tol biopolymer transport system component
MLATLPSYLMAQTRSGLKQKTLSSVGEFVRFSDPTTETFVVRLTSLKSASFLPAAANRFVSVKERYLLFSSDRDGSLSPYQVNLRTGVVHKLANGVRLSPESLCLDPKERWVYFIDDAKLQRVEIAKKESRRSAAETIAEGVTRFSISPSGSIFVIRAGALEQIDNGTTTRLVAADGIDCLSHPASKGCLITNETSTNGREFWYAASDSTKPVLLAKGAISDPFWSPDGRSLVFLRDITTPNVTLAEIHEVGTDGAGERCIAPTSQFAAFAPNFDGSVFVGASRSKAQPNVVLLLRSAKREMTLCQHHASHPAMVSPAFSPDARRVYFQSDEEGKPAIYSVNVELLVEPPSESGEV